MVKERGAELVKETISNFISQTVGLGRPAGNRFVGEFELIDRLGAGGMGEVWKAHQFETFGNKRRKRVVALKLIRSQALGANRKALEQYFSGEMQALFQIQDANVIRYISHGKDGDDFYLVTEFVDGPNAHSLVRKADARDQSIPCEVAVYIAQMLASGLQEIHNHDLVHGDVKPENSFIRNNGHVLVGDLGLAQLQGRSGQAGTPAFLSPEQAKGTSVHHQSDIYSLGCTLYFLLTGQAPYADQGNATPEFHIRCHRDEKKLPTDPKKLRSEISKGLRDVLLSMLSKQPSNRPRNCNAVVAQLAPFACDRLGMQSFLKSLRDGKETIQDTSVGWTEVSAARQTFTRRQVMLGTGTGLFASVGVAAVLLQRDRPFQKLRPEDCKKGVLHDLLKQAPVKITGEDNRLNKHEVEKAALRIESDQLYMVELGQLEAGHPDNLELSFDLLVHGSWNGRLGFYFGRQDIAGNMIHFQSLELSDNAHPVIQPACEYQIKKAFLGPTQDPDPFDLLIERNIKLPRMDRSRRVRITARNEDRIARLEVGADLDLPMIPLGKVNLAGWDRDLLGGFGVYVTGLNVTIDRPQIRFF